MTATASTWIARWAHLVRPGGTVLDVAAGQGRHTRWFAARGHRVAAIDRDADAMAALAGHAEPIVADLEGMPWPLPGRSFDAVVVTNYLWRPLFAHLKAALAPGGVLLYETFALGNEAFGRPRRPEFLLAPGELLTAAEGLRIVAYEHGMLTDPDRMVQRIAAVRVAGDVPGRWPSLVTEASDAPPLESRDSGPSA